MSEMRRIETLWITRKSIDGGHHPPELLEAWDDFSVDENPEGWERACKKALALIGDDLAEKRYLTLAVRPRAIDDAFWPGGIEARVEKASDTEETSE